MSYAKAGKSASTIAPSPRLIREGRLFSWAAGLALAATAIFDLLLVAAMALRSKAVGVSGASFVFNYPPQLMPAVVPIAHFPIWQSSLATLLLVLRLAPGLVILWHLADLFAMYGRGEVFTARNESCVRVIAWSLLAYACVPFVTHTVLFVSGMSPLRIHLESRQIDALVAGLILLAVMRVVSFGVAIDEDRQGFV